MKVALLFLVLSAHASDNNSLKMTKEGKKCEALRQRMFAAKMMKNQGLKLDENKYDELKDQVKECRRKKYIK